jgi:hypothetical protein
MLQDGQFLCIHALPYATRFILVVPADPRLNVAAEICHQKLETAMRPALQMEVFINMLQRMQDDMRCAANLIAE